MPRKTQFEEQDRFVLITGRPCCSDHWPTVINFFEKRNFYFRRQICFNETKKCSWTKSWKWTNADFK